jgi:hypothetical protein
MPEITRQNTLVVPSVHTEAWLTESQLDLSPDVDALMALADQLGTELPEYPRLHVVNRQNVHDIRLAIQDRKYPDPYSNDIIIQLTNQRHASDEDRLLQATAQALARRQRAASSPARMRIGGALVASGVTVSSVGYAEWISGHEWGVYLKPAGVILGVAGVTVLGIPAHRDTSNPGYIANGAPPIRVVPLSAEGA